MNEFQEALTQYPDVVVERIRWVLLESYDEASARAARNILRRSQTAQEAAFRLIRLVAGLEWNTGPQRAERAWLALSKEEQDRLVEKIAQEIEELRKDGFC